MSQVATNARRRLARPGSDVRGGYDAARYGGDNADHWINADSLGPVAANDPVVRRALRDRTRYEVRNNPTMAGVTDIVASDTIGRGPQLQVLTDDEEWNEKAEEAWDEWSGQIYGGLGLAMTLLIARRSKTDSGEVFGRFLQTRENRVGLDIELIEADRVCDPTGMSVYDGIELDERGRPRRYKILREHPGDAFHSRSSMVEAEWVPAEQVVHYFTRTRPGQIRGVPDLSPSLNLLAEIRRYQAAVLAACEVQASIPLTIETDSAFETSEEDMPAMPWDEVPIDRRIAMALPPGHKLGGVNPSHPVMQHVEYVASLLVHACRPLKVPRNIVLGDSSEYSYASGRLDMQDYDRARMIDRLAIERLVVDRVFDAFLTFAIRRGVLPFPMTGISYIHREWLWHGRPHVEPVKEASAAKTRLETLTDTLSDIWSAKGQKWDVKLHQIARERALLKELKLSLGEASGQEIDDAEDDEPGRSGAGGAAGAARAGRGAR